MAAISANGTNRFGRALAGLVLVVRPPANFAPRPFVDALSGARFRLVTCP